MVCHISFGFGIGRNSSKILVSAKMKNDFFGHFRYWSKRK